MFSHIVSADLKSQKNAMSHTTFIFYKRTDTCIGAWSVFGVLVKHLIEHHTTNKQPIP